MVQQLCASAQSKWQSKVMPRPSMIKSSTNKTGAQILINDILPKLNKAKQLSPMDVSYGYHYLKLE